MGLDVALECEENCCQAASRRKIVHPSFDNHPKEEERIEWKALRKKIFLKNLNGDSCEFSCNNYPSPRCQSMPARPVGRNLKDNEVVKRSSLYQSSREIRIKKLREGRRNVKLTHSDKGFISFEIVDSLSHIFRNEASHCQQEKISPCASLNAKVKSAPTDTSLSIQTSSIEPTDVPLLPEEHSKVKGLYPSFTSAKNSSAFPSANADLELFGRELVRKPNLKCNQMLGTENGGEVLYEQDTVDTLTKSFSAKAGISYPPCQLERDLFRVSTKTWLNPLKKMLNPIMKSKPQRNPSLMEREDTCVRTIDCASIRRNSMYCKFLSNDFLKATKKMEPIGRVIKRDQGSVSSSSPAHVQGTLRLHYKYGIPYFEFSTRVPEDVLSAKAWRTDNAFNWVYTFYSCKKRGNNIGSGKKDKRGHSFPIIGQMQVSTYLCLETSCNVTSNQSTVTQFILYDIAHARRSFAVEEGSQCSSDSIQPLDISSGDFVIGSPIEAKCSTEPANCQYTVRHALSECDYDASSFSPWEPADLHSHLEIAAIVIQIPSNKKESTKNVEVDVNITRELLNMSSVSAIDQIKGTISSKLNPANVKVVTPSGTHGLAATEKGGPSSLLDRWRSGGGCDCGGWDMACPIFVFGNSSGVVADCPTMGSQPSIALFFQGRKEKISALSISPDGGGLYSVQFHAQLSALQAFSICIALLHSSETSPLVDKQSR